jgi:hypothetical protein
MRKNEAMLLALDNELDEVLMPQIIRRCDKLNYGHRKSPPTSSAGLVAEHLAEGESECASQLSVCIALRQTLPEANNVFTVYCLRRKMANMNFSRAQFAVEKFALMKQSMYSAKRTIRLMMLQRC